MNKSILVSMLISLLALTACEENTNPQSVNNDVKAEAITTTEQVEDVASVITEIDLEDERLYAQSIHTGNDDFENDINPEMEVFDKANNHDSLTAEELQTINNLIPKSPFKGFKNGIDTMSDDSPITNEQLDDINRLTLDNSKSYFVYGSRLRVRSMPIVGPNILGVLDINDELKLVSGEVVEDFVEVEIVSTSSQISDSPTGKFFVGYKYISRSKRKDLGKLAAGKYFMIQNLATEKLRLYEKQCDGGSGHCNHKMILEADMAIGEPGETETRAGYYHITEWIKFYQDGAGRYPSWYHPNYRMPPKPGASASTWTKSKYLPYKGAKVRGAFGWYTAKVGPNSAYQWTHGTLGWGSDGKKYINITRGFWANLFMDPRSHGCSRTDNETIAYIRQLLPKGAPIIKVYAKEAYGDKNLYRYNEEKSNWDYILTKNGSRTDGQKSDREDVLNARTPKDQWLEEGTYKVDKYPNATAFISGGSGSKSGRNGNVYGLKHQHMGGVYLVDKGVLVNYTHPRKVRLGGYKDQILPNYVEGTSNQPITMPDCPKNKNRRRRCSEQPSI